MVHLRGEVDPGAALQGGTTDGGSQLPEGTVTFLFTDVVASTEMIGQFGEEAADVLRQQHFQLLRDAVKTSRGWEIKNLGDGLMVVFASALDAVSCAVAMQLQVYEGNRSQPAQTGLRVGIHVGEAISTDDDYFGLPVVTAARLCAQADGGQIVVSNLVTQLAISRRSLRFRRLGELQLKGIAEPVMAHWVDWKTSAGMLAEPRRWDRSRAVPPGSPSLDAVLVPNRPPPRGVAVRSVGGAGAAFGAVLVDHGRRDSRQLVQRDWLLRALSHLPSVGGAIIAAALALLVVFVLLSSASGESAAPSGAVLQVQTVFDVVDQPGGGKSYGFLANDGELLTVTLTTEALRPFRAYIELYDPAGALIAWSDGDGSEQVEIRQQFVSLVGEYTVTVRGFSEADTGSFRLEVVNQVGAAFDRSTAAAFGRLEVPSDIGQVSLRVAPGEAVSVIARLPRLDRYRGVELVLDLHAQNGVRLLSAASPPEIIGYEVSATDGATLIAVVRGASSEESHYPIPYRLDFIVE